MRRLRRRLRSCRSLVSRCRCCWFMNCCCCRSFCFIIAICESLDPPKALFEQSLSRPGCIGCTILCSGKKPTPITEAFFPSGTDCSARSDCGLSRAKLNWGFRKMLRNSLGERSWACSCGRSSDRLDNSTARVLTFTQCNGTVTVTCVTSFSERGS